MFILDYRLSEFLLYLFANRFELRCERKQLMLLYYKICLVGTLKLIFFENQILPKQKAWIHTAVVELYTDCIFVVIAIDRLMDTQRTAHGLSQ